MVCRIITRHQHLQLWALLSPYMFIFLAQNAASAGIRNCDCHKGLGGRHTTPSTTRPAKHRTGHGHRHYHGKPINGAAPETPESWTHPP